MAELTKEQLEKMGKNGNGKGFNQPSPASDRPKPAQRNSSNTIANPKKSDDIKANATQAAESLQLANIDNAAHALTRMSQQFEADTDAIADVVEVLLDPEAKVAAGILKAAQRINDRKEAGLDVPFGGGFAFQMPELPGVPDFSYYSRSIRSAALPSSPATN